jgi:hypothetical protein
MIGLASPLVAACILRWLLLNEDGPAKREAIHWVQKSDSLWIGHSSITLESCSEWRVYRTSGEAWYAVFCGRGSEYLVSGCAVSLDEAKADCEAEHTRILNQSLSEMEIGEFSGLNSSTSDNHFL